MVFFVRSGGLCGTIHGVVALTSKHRVRVRANGLTGRTSNSIIIGRNSAVLLTAMMTTGSTGPSASFVPLRIRCGRGCTSYKHCPNNFVGHRNHTGSDRVLITHLVSHTLHPLFPTSCRTRICIAIGLVSTSGSVRPSTLTNLTTSTTLTISSVPFKNPVSRIHITHLSKRCIVGPGFSRVSHISLSVVINNAVSGVLVIRNRVGRISRRIVLKTVGFTRRRVGGRYTMRVRLSGRLNGSIGHACYRRRGSRRLHRLVIGRLCSGTCTVTADNAVGRRHRSVFGTLRTRFTTHCSRRRLTRGTVLVRGCFRSSIRGGTVHGVVLSRNLHLSNHGASRVHPV